MTALPDIPLPAGIRSRYVDGINGLRMHVLEAGFETKGLPCVLLLHGFPELAYSWRHQLPALVSIPTCSTPRPPKANPSHTNHPQPPTAIPPHRGHPHPTTKAVRAVRVGIHTRPKAGCPHTRPHPQWHPAKPPSPRSPSRSTPSRPCAARSSASAWR